MLTQECCIVVAIDEFDRAMAFYITAFGSGEAEVEIEHVAYGEGEASSGASRIDLHIGGVVIALVSRAGLVSRSLNDEPVVLDVDDLCSATSAAWDAGATILAGNFDKTDGEPACRLRDPFGREWLLRQRRAAA